MWELDRAPAIVSVVAKSNTGKTTLIERLIPALKARGVRVGVIKHHSHPGTFDTPGKDTHRVAEAGADVVVGLGRDQVAVFTNTQCPPEIPEVVDAHLGEMDLVLTEGFKHGPYPKIEVNRMGRSEELMCAPSELLALVTDGAWDIGVPTFHLDDVDTLAQFLIRQLRLSAVRNGEPVRVSNRYPRGAMAAG